MPECHRSDQGKYPFCCPQCWVLMAALEIHSSLLREFLCVGHKASKVECKELEMLRFAGAASPSAVGAK